MLTVQARTLCAHGGSVCVCVNKTGFISLLTTVLVRRISRQKRTWAVLLLRNASQSSIQQIANNKDKDTGYKACCKRIRVPGCTQMWQASEVPVAPNIENL